MNEHPTQQHPGEPYLPPVYVEHRQPPMPLAAVLLAVGVASVLICLAKPDVIVGERVDPRLFLLVVLLGGVPGGILAMIMVLYSYNSWVTVAVSYFVGSATMVTAISMLAAPHSILPALAAAALLVLFGLAVRLLPRRQNDEPPTFEPIRNRPIA